MTLRLFISLNLLALISLAARAQTVEDFFNGGAQLYISNNIPAALEKTESGLKLYPNDTKLKKLEELLKQQQQSQNQSQQNQQQQNQQKQSQKEQSQQKQNQQKQNENSQQQSQKKSGDGKNEQSNTMTPQEAKRLLDAQKGNEQFLQLKPQGKPQNNNQPIKDW